MIIQFTFSLHHYLHLLYIENSVNLCVNILWHKTKNKTSTKFSYMRMRNNKKRENKKILKSDKKVLTLINYFGIVKSLNGKQEFLNLGIWRFKMTNKEILAELKKSYEYLTDIRENGCHDHCCGQIKNKIDKLDIARGYIEEIYFDFYKTLDKEELRVEQIERKVGEKVYISRNVDGNYEVGEDLYGITCCDLDYYWYEDRDFIEESEEE